MTKAMKELRGLSEQDIQKRIGELKEELVKVRTQIGSGTAPQLSGSVRTTKRTIARLKTALREKELQELQREAKKEVKKEAKGETEKA